MGLISVRLDDEDERFLRRNRLVISDVVREAVHARVRQLQSLKALDALASLRWESNSPVEDTVRRIRDGKPVRD